MAKAAVLVLLTSFALVALFGVTLMSEHAGMAGCPLMNGHDSLCSLPVLGHIEAWQAIFIMMAIQALVLCAAFLYFILKIPARALPPGNPAFDEAERSAPHALALNFLSRALARGIVHPRVYA